MNIVPTGIKRCVCVCLQQVPCSSVEREFWRLVGSMEDEVCVCVCNCMHVVCVHVCGWGEKVVHWLLHHVPFHGWTVGECLCVCVCVSGEV